MNRIYFEPIDTENRTITFDLDLYYKLRVIIKGITLSTKTNRLVKNEPDLRVHLKEDYADPCFVSNGVCVLYRNIYYDYVNGYKVEYNNQTRHTLGGCWNGVLFRRSQSTHTFNADHRIQRNFFGTHEECIVGFHGVNVTLESQRLKPNTDDNVIIAEGSAKLEISGNNGIWYLFKFSPTGKLFLYQHADHEQLVVKGIGGRLGEYDMIDLFSSRECKNKIEERKKSSASKLSNIHLRSMTRLEQIFYMLKSEIVTDQSEDNIVVAPLVADSQPETYNLKFDQHPGKTFVLEALSFSTLDNQAYDARLIYSGRMENKVSYIGIHFRQIINASLVESRIITNFTHNFLLPIPNDITHWQKCRKIVSLYGYLYTLHDLEDDILSLRKVAQSLPSITDYPIVAMHADADSKFWFLSMNTELVQVYFDTNNCGTLQKDVNILPEFKTLARALTNVEDEWDTLYYKFSENIWYYIRNDPKQPPPLPPPPDQPNQPRPPVPEKSNFMTWIYVLCGVVIGVIFIIIIVVQLLNSSAPSRPNIVYSRSKEINQGRGSLRSADGLGSKTTLQQAQQISPVPPTIDPNSLIPHQHTDTASAMPLLAGEETSKTIGSSGSKGSKGSRGHKANKRHKTGGVKRVSPLAKQHSPHAKHSPHARHSPSPPTRPSSSPSTRQSASGKHSPSPRQSPKPPTAARTPTSLKGSPKQ